MESRLAGVEFNRYGDVFNSHQPVAIDLAISIGDPHGHVEYLALLIFPGYMLNAMAVAQVAFGHHGKIGDLEVYRAVDIVQKFLPILAIRLGADVWARRDHIEDE